MAPLSKAVALAALRWKPTLNGGAMDVRKLR